MKAGKLNSAKPGLSTSYKLHLFQKDEQFQGLLDSPQAEENDLQNSNRGIEILSIGIHK